MNRARFLIATVALAAALGLFLPSRSLATPAWLANGLPVAPNDSLESDPVIASDGVGGAFIAWQDYRSGWISLFSQHLTADGTPAPGWLAGGRSVSVSYAYDPMIIADGHGGAFVSGADGTAVGLWHLAADGSNMFSSEPTVALLSRDPRDGAAILQRGRSNSALSPSAVTKEMPAGLTFLAPDAAGGTFMAWETGGRLRENVLVQHYTAAGAVAPGWPSGGASPESVYFDQYAPVLCRDGADGVIVASLGYGDSGQVVRVQRLSNTGTIVPGWPGAGLPVCIVRGTQNAPGIISDSSGGAIVLWLDSRNGSFEQLYAQRVSATGVVAAGWPADGRPVSTFPCAVGLIRYSGYGRAPQRYSAVVTDGSGGALIVWQDTRADSGDIYAQHILGDGSLAPGWPENGLPLCTASGTQLMPSLSTDEAGGAFVTWQDDRSGAGWNVYAQHVTGSGAIAPGWPVDGVPVCTAPGDHVLPRLADDNSGGTIVSWQDARCGSAQVFASHVAIDGTVPTLQGIPSVSVSATSTYADSGTVRVEWQIMGLSPAGAIVTVYCRQIDGPWLAVARVAPDLSGHVIYADRGAIAGCRYGYALGVSSCGAQAILGATWVDIPNGSGFFPLSVSTQSVRADSGRVHLLWNLDGGEGLTIKVFRRDSCSSWTQIADTVADDAGIVSFEDHGPFFEGRREYYRLGVHACGQDSDLGQLWADIMPGDGVVSTTASLVREQVDSTTALLVWQELSGPTSVGRIYRQDSTGSWVFRAEVNPDPASTFTFSEGGLIRGSRYEYRLGLSSCGVEKLFGPAVVDIPLGPQPRLTFAIRSARPNPASQALTISFTLVGSSRATLEMVDATGRRVMNREVGNQGPGDYDLLLGDVSSLRPGLYLVRLRQGARSQSRRVAVVH